MSCLDHGEYLWRCLTQSVNEIHNPSHRTGHGCNAFNPLGIITLRMCSLGDQSRRIWSRFCSVQSWVSSCGWLGPAGAAGQSRDHPRRRWGQRLRVTKHHLHLTMEPGRGRRGAGKAPTHRNTPELLHLPTPALPQSPRAARAEPRHRPGKEEEEIAVKAVGTPGCPAPPRGAPPGRCLRGQRRPFPAPASPRGRALTASSALTPGRRAPRPPSHPAHPAPPVHPSRAAPRGPPRPARRSATPGSSGKGLPPMPWVTFSRRLQLRRPASPGGPASGAGREL